MPIGDLNSLVNHLIENGVLKTPVIIDAFKNIDRLKFAPEDMRCFAYVDEALSIPGGQTISQPYTVAFMLELLEPKPGEKIMDIGAGSGWQTALLAHIMREKGRVFAVEIVPELCKFGKKNVSQFNFIEKEIVRWLCGDASKKETFEPVKDEISGGIDKIIVAAALSDVRSPTSHNSSDALPQLWKDQLKIGGRMVVPIKDSIWLFVKKGENDFETAEYPGFVFVPFVSK
jgi:protein-L-isoaspartate(D-aspartate) O-methyltransferase